MACETSSRTTSGTENKVSRPSDNEDVEDLPNGERFNSNNFSKLNIHSSLRISVDSRDVGFTFSQVVTLGVMNVMRPLPGEVRNQKRSVEDITQSVVKKVAVRESLVTAFVTQNPKTSSNSTVNNSISNPKREVSPF